MTWVRLDDGFFRNRKARAVGIQGRALYLAGLCFCATASSDGCIPKHEVRLVAAEAEVSSRLAGRLVKERLWEDRGDHYFVPDYLDLNPSRAKVDADRAQAKERKRRQRARHGVTNGDVTASVTASVTHPPQSPIPPTPSTYASSSSSPELSGVADDVDEVLSLYADRKLAASNGTIRNPAPWKRKVLANARVELAGQITEWRNRYDVTSSELADALLAGSVPPSWRYNRKDNEP